MRLGVSRIKEALQKKLRGLHFCVFDLNGLNWEKLSYVL